MYCLRKNAVRLFCMIFLGLVFFISGFEVSASYSSYINGKNINIRSKPTTSAKIVTTLSNKKVVVTAKSGNWSKISCGKISGWVRTDFLKTASTSKTTSAKPVSTAKYAMIKGQNINIRSSNNTNCKVIAKISNKKVQILSSSGEWYKISVDGKTGWVKKNFVTETALSSRQLQPKKTVSVTISSGSGLIKGKDINLRSKPTKTAKVVGKISNKTVKILSKSGTWYKISYNGLTGWVSADFVSITTAKTATTKKATTNEVIYGLINKTDVNIRSKPTSSAKIVAKLSKKKVTILSTSGDWYKISYGKTTGWVSKKLVTVSGEVSSSSNLKVATLRNRLILYSRGFLGTRYVYGGSAPGGFDCSGFTSYVYKKFGIKIERTASAQAKQGKYVAKSNLRPGDLVFFKTDSSAKPVTHAGIYIGNGKFIHASSGKSKKKVTISSLSESFYSKTYVTGRTFMK